MSLDDDRYQLVALIINTILGDIAYDKYKIEEEDMLYSL